MTIRRRRDRREDGTVRERWQIDFWVLRPDGSKKRVRRTLPLGHTKRDAQQLEQVMRANEVAADAHPEWSTETFEAFAARWFAQHVVPNNKPATQVTRASILKNHLLPALGDVPLRRLSRRHVTDLTAELRAKKLAPSSVRRVLALVRSILRKACEWGAAPKPAFDWPYPKIRGESVRPGRLTESEVSRIAELADDAIRRPLVFALHTGLRIGELRALRWADVIDGDRPHVVVRHNYSRDVPTTPKSGRSRTVPLNTAALGALPQRGRAGDPVFGSGPVPLSAAGARRIIRRARRDTGISDLRWHRLRHTFGTRLAEQGTPLHLVQTLLGHSDVRTTMVYVHAEHNALHDAVARLASQTESAASRQAPSSPEDASRIVDRDGAETVELSRLVDLSPRGVWVHRGHFGEVRVRPMRQSRGLI